MRAVAFAAAFVFASADDWSDFKEKYGKVYNGGEDEEQRKVIFGSNLQAAAAHNAKGSSWTQGVTRFSDLTADEFRARYLGGFRPRGAGTELAVHRYSGAVLPDSVDWRSQGAVTSVKDQGMCGSCWAFSVTGSLEGRAQIATGKLVNLSEQQFVDCDRQWDAGCGGGEPEDALNFAQGTDLCTQASYPYIADDAQCQDSGCDVALTQGSVTGHVLVDRYSDEAMMEAVAAGPVSVGVDAMLFQRYTGGILDDSCGTSIDHAVLIVGYGGEAGKDYWLVKNSWSEDWGEKGYIRMCRGCGMSSGECAILKEGVYPTIASSSVLV